jgi:osmotically-inducible protein OsmY
MTLTERVESSIRKSTHDRIRDLTVEEVQGHLVVRGTAPSYHAKQLALHGAMKMVTGHQISTEITVG